MWDHPHSTSMKIAYLLKLMLLSTAWSECPFFGQIWCVESEGQPHIVVYGCQRLGKGKIMIWQYASSTSTHDVSAIILAGHLPVRWSILIQPDPSQANNILRVKYIHSLWSRAVIDLLGVQKGYVSNPIVPPRESHLPLNLVRLYALGQYCRLCQTWALLLW